jgi:hypothetical protein
MGSGLTLFADQAIVPVVRIVRVSSNRASSISYYSEVEFYGKHKGKWVSFDKIFIASALDGLQLLTKKLMAKSARVTRAK